jgi:hypothetical protein
MQGFDSRSLGQVSGLFNRLLPGFFCYRAQRHPALPAIYKTTPEFRHWYMAFVVQYFALLLKTIL